MTKTKSTAVLLDTHVWIWLNNGSPELKTADIALIDKAAHDGQLFVAAISLWEMATLVAKKRLVLQTSTQDWVDKALQQPGITVLALSPEIAVESAQLGDTFHGDPADRLIVASARLHNLLLMTRDEKIVNYGEKGYAKVKRV